MELKELFKMILLNVWMTSDDDVTTRWQEQDYLQQ